MIGGNNNQRRAAYAEVQREVALEQQDELAVFEAERWIDTVVMEQSEAVSKGGSYQFDAKGGARAMAVNINKMVQLR